MKNKPQTDLNPLHFRVAIFGSAKQKMNDPEYKQIYHLARMIAEQGMDVVTGGGPGLMEAANKGHTEGRISQEVHSLGLSIKLPVYQPANEHLDIKAEFDRFSERLDHFMTLSHIVVVAPGGIGTLLEFMYTWQLEQVSHVCNFPIILLGKMWPSFMKWIEKWPVQKKLILKKDLKPIFLAKNSEEAMKIIKKAHKEFLKKGPDYCLNSKKYKIET